MTTSGTTFFICKTQIACRPGVVAVVVCFTKGLHFRLVTLYFGDMKRVKYKPQLNHKMLSMKLKKSIMISLLSVLEVKSE